MDIEHSAGGVILNENNEVVIVRQGTDDNDISWSFPKGHVEEGEDYFTTAKREIEEEAGITELQFIKDLPEYGRHPLRRDGTEDVSRFKKLHFFLFRTYQKELKPKDPQNPEARWVHQSKVAELLSNPKDKQFFTEIMTILETLDFKE